jgi:hypothetical protein
MAEFPNLLAPSNASFALIAAEFDILRLWNSIQTYNNNSDQSPGTGRVQGGLTFGEARTTGSNRD